MNDLKNALNRLANELRKPLISYTRCDKLRIKIDDLNKEYHYEYDDMMYRKINDICYEYHHEDMDYRNKRYQLVGKIYNVIDLMADNY